MTAVFDTNILIDYLNGLDAARTELDRFTTRQISIISYIEVLVGARDAAEATAIRGFLTSFKVLELSADVAEKTIALRKTLGLKIPDAIIYATARNQGCILVSRNTKDLKSEWPDVRMPYDV